MTSIHEGHMDFVDNVIDRSTGTIRGRAVFANPNNIFTPGMFARVRVPGSPPYEALLVPDAAIGTEQVRKFVLTVNADNAVVPKYVTLGQTTRRRLAGASRTDLTADDRVIVNGLMRARPGQKVTPQEEGKRRDRPRKARARRSRRNKPGRNRCVFRISSSTGRSSPPWSRSCS